MKQRLVRTKKGEAAGWVWMHNGGWVRNPESRYDPPGSYTTATKEDLEIAKANGELEVQCGRTVHVGGILHDWIPEENKNA